MWKEPEADQIVRLLKETRTIAVVGMSNRPHRPSYGIGAYLLRAGYRIFPVNPAYPEILGLKCFPGLLDIPEPVDLVNVFRNPDEVMPVVEEAITIKARAIWFQLGVINPAAIRRAKEAGLEVVVDRCIKVEYSLYYQAIRGNG